MCKKEHMVQEPHMIVVTVEKELMELHNLDHLLTKSCQKDKKLYQDHTEECSVLDVLNQELLEHSYLNKLDQLNRQRKLLRND